MRKIKVKAKNEKATLKKGNSEATGFDLTCCDYELGEVVGGLDVIKLKLGVEIEMPQGTFGWLVPRSSFAKKYPAMVGNSVGVIDNDYRGELILVVKPLIACYKDMIAYEQYRDMFLKTVIGERVAQLVIAPQRSIEVEFVDELSDTERGSGGFGSTD